MIQTAVKIISNKELMPGVFLTWLEAPEIAAEAIPGQFVMVHCGETYDMLLRRPISIHQREKDRIALLYRLSGKGTQWLSEQGKDRTLDVIGPLGNGFDISSRSKELLLVAGGMGVAPTVFLAQDAIAHNFNVTMLIGAAKKELIYPKNLLPSRARVMTASDDGSSGRRGMVTELIPNYIEKADQVFACGPLPMYITLAIKKEALLRDKPLQLSLEMRMACGHGVCYGCTVETRNGLKQVCKDGPVFDLTDIEATLKDEAVCGKWLMT